MAKTIAQVSYHLGMTETHFGVFLSVYVDIYEVVNFFESPGFVPCEPVCDLQHHFEFSPQNASRLKPE